ncbi:Potassium voltage-gated channel subfamily H member 2 isoform 1 [Schistosoma japonicum]|uniref:Potassium voltage-gated channel subfamily H member 2 isoform 1 n=1 Tax=Schistosoma japonicum TaxID=6182 RepID=A0A4Z2CQG5_SCHJA|nr:Potassium voltage-gated channel subfamily H member 2 isoform 1 [Schistosoma japonicum]
MSQHKGLSTPQNKFLETIVARSDALHANFVLGNAQRKYYPIVYCSDGFLLLTNYSRANVMSRSSVCQFLWGSETTPTVRMEINQAFHNHYEYRNRVVFYTRTGEPFTCDFTVTPIRNEKSEVVLFLCSYQQIPNDLLHSNVNQSIFKMNQSKLYSIHSWASELPFSKSYLQMKNDNFDGAVENDETCLQRSNSKVNITQASSPEDTSRYKVLSNQTITSLNIVEPVCPTILSTSHSCQTLVKEPQIKIQRNSYDIQSNFQNETNIRYPTEYYLPSYCQPASFGDIKQEPSNNITSQGISQAFNKCIRRNFSTLSLPQIKSQLKNFKHRKIKAITSEKVNNRRIYDFESTSPERSPVVSYTKLRTTNSYKHSRMKPNKKSEAIENDRKINFWETFDYLPNSSTLSNQSVYNESNKDDIRHLTISNLQQTNSKTVNQSPSALKTESNDEATSSESGGEIKQDKNINCFSCISQRLSDSRPYQYGNISGKICEPDPKKYSYKRRKSLAIIHGLNFRGRKIRKSNSSKFNRQIKNFSGKNVPEYKIQKLTKSNFVLLHYGLFRIIWDWLLLILTFYIAFIVPYNVTFESHSTHSGRCRIIDLIVEIFLIVDVILNFHTTYVNKSGQIVNNRHLIAKHYAKGWLILDVLAALPVDFILIFFQITSIINLEDIKINTNLIETMNVNVSLIKTHEEDFNHSKHDTRPIVKFNLISLLQMMKLARLLRLARLIQKIIRLSQYSVIVLGLLMFSFALVAHWCACIWYVIGLYEIDGTDVGWLEDLARRLRSPFHLNRSGGPTEGSKYFTALYFTCSSLTSVGFGNVSANTTNEKIFAICIMLLGALMHAAVFGNVTAIIQRMYARRTTFQSKVQDLKEFIEVHRIPKTLKSRMQDFFQTTWAINRGIDVPEVLKIYPEELQGDIYLHLNREVLGLKVFEKASRDCLKSLAINFKLTFCTPGEYLIHTGDILRRLYFVSNGSLEVLERDEVVALLGKNDWFGAFVDPDIPIIRSKCDVKSLTYCDLHYIDLITLSEILNQHPRFKAELKNYLYEDLSFNIQEGAETFYSNDVITVPAITLQLANDDKDWENSETNLSIIEDVESLKPPQFIFDNKGRSCSLTTYDIESGLLKSHSNNRSNSELSFIKSTSAITTPKISRINEKHLQFRSPSLVTEHPSHYPRRLQSSDKIVTRRRFFLLKSSKSLGCSNNADLTQKFKEKKSSISLF